VGGMLQAAAVRRKANAALARTAAQFEALLGAAPLGIYLVDDEFRIAAVNPVARPVFGDIPDLIGSDFEQAIRRLWPREYADEISGHFRRTLETGVPYLVPERAEKRLDLGITEYYEWQIHRIPLPDGRHGVVCYFRDISQVVGAREALRESDQRKDEFIATLSHELRNPLAPIRSALHLLGMSSDANPPLARIHEMMERQVNHLVRLVDDLLEVSRISRGKLELRKEPVDIAPIVRHAVEIAEPLVQASRHRLSVSFPGEALMLNGDPVRLGQMLGNILNNAAKYTEPGGEIDVSVARKGGSIVIRVKDTGMGISAAELESIFEMFTRGSDLKGQGGLGIGLALARQLAVMHGGSIEASSDGPGLGSEFRIRLPLSDVASARPGSGGKVGADLQGRQVLVVDDNRDAGDSLAMVLRILGCDVRVARDGMEALQTLQDFPAAVVLLDIGMPGMDGYEVARQIHARFPARRPVIVALTGWGQEQDRKRAQSAGFDHHMVKPAEIATLHSLLASL
jgi:signal transduction histidine kinase